MSLKLIAFFIPLFGCNVDEKKTEEKKPEPVPVQMTPIAQSDCAKHLFKNRGKAPLAFLEGMAKVYERECHSPINPLGPSERDALSLYGMRATQLDVFTLLIGLGMRESSGKYCEGRDLSAHNVTASTAEAGMFQFSFNSISADSTLRSIYTYYKGHPESCELETFSKNVTCKQSDKTIYGSGEGAEFQRLARSCPAFSAVYAASLIRVLRKHFGPLNRHEAEVVPACQKMLEERCT